MSETLKQPTPLSSESSDSLKHTVEDMLRDATISQLGRTAERASVSASFRKHEHVTNDVENTIAGLDSAGEPYINRHVQLENGTDDLLSGVYSVTPNGIHIIKHSASTGQEYRGHINNPENVERAAAILQKRAAGHFEQDRLNEQRRKAA